MIYITAHKETPVPRLAGYIPIQVGFAEADFSGYVRDNTGENISRKNKNYCELTALYWVWKNTDDAYKGLVHYRRFFGTKPISGNAKNICTYEQMTGYLKDYDIVLCRPAHYHVTAGEQILLSSTTETVMKELRAVVAGTEPAYLEAYDRFFAQNKASLYNMMFCRRELFDRYCAWLFGILGKLEERIDLDGLNSYQKRVYGFLAERLLNVWVMKEGLRVKYTGIVNTELSFKENATLIRRDITNEIRFRTGKRKIPPGKV